MPSAMKKNSRLIILERNRFALLVKSYRKSLYVIHLLTHICRVQNVDITMPIEEICQVLELDPQKLAKQRDKGNIHCTTDRKQCLYEITDIIRYKVASEMADIYRTINEASVLPRSRPKK